MLFRIFNFRLLALWSEKNITITGNSFLNQAVAFSLHAQIACLT